MRKIQVLGPGCPDCDRLADSARMAVEELGIDAVVERVTEIEAILRFDVLLTPALAIDGRIVAVGAGGCRRTTSSGCCKGRRDNGLRLPWAWRRDRHFATVQAGRPRDGKKEEKELGVRSVRHCPSSNS